MFSLFLLAIIVLTYMVVYWIGSMTRQLMLAITMEYRKVTSIPPYPTWILYIIPFLVAFIVWYSYTH